MSMEDMQAQLRALQQQVEVLTTEKTDLQADLDDAYANIDELEAQSGFKEARDLKEEAIARAVLLQEENERLSRENYRLDSERQASESANDGIRRELAELRAKESDVTHSNTHLMKQLEKLNMEFERCVGASSTRAWTPRARPPSPLPPPPLAPPTPSLSRSPRPPLSPSLPAPPLQGKDAQC